MSSASGSSSPFVANVPQRQATWSWKIQNFATPQTYAAKSANEAKWQPSTKPVVSVPTTSTNVPIAYDATNNPVTDKQIVRQRRRLNAEEEEIKDEIAGSVASSLELDQLFTLYPDTESPFETELDVVKRLLPYHVYQHPERDLRTARGIKGKAKVSEIDTLKQEIKETRFALECHKRYKVLEQRLRSARIKPGIHASPLDQAIVLERLALESDQAITSALEQELSSSRSELDKIQRAQRAAKMNVSAPRMMTTQSSTVPYFGYTTPTFSASPTSLSNYYSSYTYPYGQSFIPGIPYASPALMKASAVPGSSSFQTSATSYAQMQPPTAAANADASAKGSVPASRPPPVSIPLQLPVTSLPALRSLGIMPVPKASLPPADAPQPAAVLLGSSNNGSMLSLEINAALLQAPQMSGLAILLSTLVKMNGADGSTSMPGQGKSGELPSSSTTGGDAAGHNTRFAPKPASSRIE